MSAALSLDDWRGQAAKLSYRNQCFIDGRFVPSASGRTFDCVSPVDGQVLTKVARGDQEDVDRAVKAARKAFESGVWSGMAPRDRKRVMLRFAAKI
ncbi:MAG TPA: aldehyde dehydrogenase family protein, partial [Alphaproteobacteria bacterium]|nr:aldehyde dehydrogenase family protein [Alphaproteobacteria bacterium]